MSRLRVSNKPGGWRDEGPSSVAQSKHVGGQMVVGQSGAPRVAQIRSMSNSERSDLPRCKRYMPIAKAFCDRPYGHSWYCMSRPSIERKKAREARRAA